MKETHALALEFLLAEEVLCLLLRVKGNKAYEASPAQIGRHYIEYKLIGGYDCKSHLLQADMIDTQKQKSCR